MKVNFLWDWKPNYWQSYTWQDGLAAALVELRNRGHEVRVYADTDQVIPNPLNTIEPIETMDKNWCDVFLHWADMTRPNAEVNFETGKPMAICFAGGEVITAQTELFNHIFVESKVYYDKLKESDYPVSIAFGTNTDLFKPVQQNIMFDAIFPATFAAWKRHDLFAKATAGYRALAVGYMYDTHEQECWQVCLDNGCMVIPHVSAEVLHRLYAASRSVLITSKSEGGSQRTVLEALAMNIPCFVTDSNKFDYDMTIRLKPDIEEIRGALQNLDMFQGVDTRSYVLDTWSHIQYADNLEKGLKSIV